MAAGGGALQATNAVLPATREIPPPPKPVVAIEIPRLEIRDMQASMPGPDLTPAVQIASFPGIGGGAGEGDGGDGAGSEDFVSPMPRSILPHWDPPKSVRGLEVTVRIHVDAFGKPTGEVYLDPPTPDRRFNREIEERVRRMEYRPASRNGSPVAGWAEITFIF
jgi:TonB family protein